MSELSKPCIRCGLDCAHGRRFRDERGKYTCGRCYDAIKARREALRAAGKLEDEPPMPADAIPLDADPAQYEARGTRTCPNCARTMPIDTLLCPHCQFNIGTGKGPHGETTGSPRECMECGYDLRGIPFNAPCPECGAEGSGRVVLPKHRAREYARAVYSTPIAWLLGGFALLMVVRMLQQRPEQLAVEVAAIAISIPFGVLAIWLYTAKWGERGDDPILLVALRMAAVFSAEMGLWALCTAARLPFLRWWLPLIALAILLKAIADLEDWNDAWILAVLLFLVRWGALVLVASTLGRAMGVTLFL